MMSASLMINQNRRLQRKGNAGFAKVGLPLAKRSGEILEPVSPIVAKRFQNQLEREVRRGQMRTGLLLIAITGVSAAIFCAVLGLF